MQLWALQPAGCLLPQACTHSCSAGLSVTALSAAVAVRRCRHCFTGFVLQAAGMWFALFVRLQAGWLPVRLEVQLQMQLCCFICNLRVA